MSRGGSKPKTKNSTYSPTGSVAKPGTKYTDVKGKPGALKNTKHDYSGEDKGHQSNRGTYKAGRNKDGSWEREDSNGNIIKVSSHDMNTKGTEPDKRRRINKDTTDHRKTGHRSALKATQTPKAKAKKREHEAEQARKAKNPSNTVNTPSTNTNTSNNPKSQSTPVSTPTTNPKVEPKTTQQNNTPSSNSSKKPDTKKKPGIVSRAYNNVRKGANKTYDDIKKGASEQGQNVGKATADVTSNVANRLNNKDHIKSEK